LSGHVEGEKQVGGSYIFSVYIYETIEDYLAMITMENRYGNIYGEKIPQAWLPLKKVIGTESTLRLIAETESQKAYL